MEAGPSPQNLSARLIPKNELDKTSVSRELTGMNKERSLQKGNSKYVLAPIVQMQIALNY